MLEFGFEVLQLKRIEAGAFINNYQSQRVCEKILMTKEGIKKNGYIRYDGVICDIIIYAMTDLEYFELIKKS